MLGQNEVKALDRFANSERLELLNDHLIMRNVNLTRTKVTRRGVRELQRVRPDLTVEVD